MTDEHDSTRRMLLTALAGLTLASVTPMPVIASPSNRGILVACFSRSGNTRVIAGVIQRALEATYFAIEPATPYPLDYFQTVAQATSERERNIRPALNNRLSDMTPYQTVYLGFPVWGTTVPPVVQTFLSSHSLAGKTLIPFITHGGYGPGNSEDVLARLAPEANREKPLIMACDQERRTTETVTQWLAESGH